MPIYLEADAFRLHNVQGFECFALLPFFSLSICGSCDEVREKVLRSKRRRDTGTLSILKLVLVQRGRLCRRWDVGIDAGEVYVDDLARVHVDYWDKVLFCAVNNAKADRKEKGRYQRMRVEVVMLREARKK